MTHFIIASLEHVQLPINNDVFKANKHIIAFFLIPEPSTGKFNQELTWRHVSSPTTVKPFQTIIN